MPLRLLNENILEQAQQDEKLQRNGNNDGGSYYCRTLCLCGQCRRQQTLCDRKKIQQITRDHSLVQEMVRMGELDPEEARKHPDKNIITRALGAEKTVDIDFFDLKLEPEM